MYYSFVDLITYLKSICIFSSMWHKATNKAIDTCKLQSKAYTFCICALMFAAKYKEKKCIVTSNTWKISFITSS